MPAYGRVAEGPKNDRERERSNFTHTSNDPTVPYIIWSYSGARENENRAPPAEYDLNFLPFRLRYSRAGEEEKDRTESGEENGLETSS